MGCNSVVTEVNNTLVYLKVAKSKWGFPGDASGKEPTCQCRRCGFDSWVGKMPWRKAWQPTAVFLPDESHGQRIYLWAIVHRVTKSWTQLKRFSMQVCMHRRVNIKSSHHKKKICNYVWWWMLTELIVVIILQYTHMLNHYAIHLKLI